MSRKHLLVLAGAAALVLVVPVVASAQGRFHGLDRNRDGVITRAEWRGNDTSFRQHDSNRDGVINGAEVRHVPAWNGNSKTHQHPAKAKPAKPAKAKVKKGNGKGKG